MSEVSRTGQDSHRGRMAYVVVAIEEHEQNADGGWQEKKPVFRERVGPEEAASSFVLHADLVERVDQRTQPAVHAEDAAVDDGAEGEVVEDLAAPAPDVGGAVLALALVVEAVDLGDLPGLVVAADERDALGVADFEREKEQEGLDGVEAAVDEVACCMRSGWTSLGTRRRARTR